MKQKIKVNPIFIIYVAVILFVVTVTLLASVKSANDYEKSRDYMDFESGWVDESGEEVSLDSLKKSGTIHKAIPEIDSDRDLSFNARNVDVEIYIDDICIYTQEKPKDSFLKFIFGKTAGSTFVDATVLKEYSGKTLYIKVVNPYKNGNACKIVNMYFGDGGDIVRHDASVQLGAFCFSAMILFIGVVCLILYIPMGIHKMIDSSMLYLGLAGFAFGMSMITDSKMLHLVVGHESLYYTISNMFMLIIPVPLLLFFQKLYGNLNKKIIAVLCILDIVDFVIVFIGTGFGKMDYNENAVFTLLIFAVSLGYIGFITIQRIIRKEHDIIFHNIGVIIIIVAVALDMILSSIGGFVETSFFTRFGIAGFTCMECTQVLWKHIENYQKGIKAQLVSRLAYHDGLTDMLNRTSFMEDMEMLENEKNKDVLLAVFDINELKYVNDNFGHTDGDEMIINVAEALNKAFDSIGKCYRTGGDEFVFISFCDEPEKNFIEANREFNKLVSEQEKKSKYPVAVAAGYVLMNESYSSLKDALRGADEKMYENKRRMKMHTRHGGSV